jgi:hypothetical protein
MYNVAIYDFGYYDLARYDSIYITEELSFEDTIESFLNSGLKIKRGYINIIQPKISINKDKLNINIFSNKPQINISKNEIFITKE